MKGSAQLLAAGDQYRHKITTHWPRAAAAGSEQPPGVITEPFTIMLWGITGIDQNWIGADEEEGALSRMAEAPARWRYYPGHPHPDQLGEIEDPKLVIPVTARAGRQF